MIRDFAHIWRMNGEKGKRLNASDIARTHELSVSKKDVDSEKSIE